MHQRPTKLKTPDAQRRGNAPASRHRLIPSITKLLVCLTIAILCFVIAASIDGMPVRRSEEITTRIDTRSVRRPVEIKGFYVATTGSDLNSGSFQQPFATLQRAIEVVNRRTAQGIEGDDIYLRGGTYHFGEPQAEDKIIHHLDLRGNAEDYTVISAMPCESAQVGCVQKLSGAWYEEVIFDEANRLTTPWARYDEREIWVTEPQFGTYLDPIENNNRLAAWKTMWGAMLLMQESDQPLLWVDSVDAIRQPGQRFYEKETGKLYARLYDDKDPNQVVMESWRNDFDRTLFGGTIKYTKFAGLTFRFQHEIFAAPRIDSGQKWDMIWEDNTFLYGDRHFTHDVKSNQFAEEKVEFSQNRNWTLRYNLIYRPCREVFQFFGAGHTIEHNHVIEHAGGWCGPATGWSIANLRNTQDAKVLYNYIKGKGALNQYNPIGSVFMLELYSDHRVSTENPECVYGGQTFAYNLFEDIESAAIITIPHGGCINKDITITDNIFKSGTGKTTGIVLSAPQNNLRVLNNVFYNIPIPIDVNQDKGADLTLDSAPSTMRFSQNIFVNCNESFSDALQQREGVVIHENLYFNCAPLVGSNPIDQDPLFMNPTANDFRLRMQSPAIIANGIDLGIYEHDAEVPTGADWWNVPATDLYPLAGSN